MLKNLYLIDIEFSEHLDTIILTMMISKLYFYRKYRNTTFAVGDEKNTKSITKRL